MLKHLQCGESAIRNEADGKNAAESVVSKSGKVSGRNRLIFGALLWVLSVMVPATTAAGVSPGSDDAEELNRLAPFYGFSGVELFKLDSRVFNMLSGDFNGDGLTDVMMADNRDSCLRLLLQRTEADASQRRNPVDVNDLQSDWRFENRQVPVDKQIAGLTTGDFNSDGRTDAAYIGMPDQLVVRYQPDAGRAEWTERWSVRLPGLKPASWMIAAGDLNGDRRHDIVVLAENVTYVLYQNDKGVLESPKSLINTSSQLSMVQVADINGDGRNDLCYVANEGSTRGLCARLQTADGRLGPEICFDLEQPRSVTVQNVDQLPGYEIITVESRTSRIVVSGLQPSEAESGSIPERLMQYGIGPGASSRSRSLVVADIDADGLQDVLVTDPEQAQLLLYRQNGIDGLGTAEVFPSLVGIRDAAASDLTGDGRVDVLLLSEKEGVLAICGYSEGRLTFPTSILRKPDDFELAAIEPLTGPGGTQIAVCLSKGSGTKAKLEFRRLLRDSDQSWKLSDAEGAPSVTGALGSRGVDLVSMDVNGDGLTDLLAVPNGSSEAGVQVLLQQADGSLNLIPRRSDLALTMANAGSLFVSGSQLLVARDSFARSVAFSESGWSVLDQFNAGESSARLEGVAQLDLDGEPGDEIVLVDTGVRRLRILRKDDGLYRPWKEVKLGSLSFMGCAVADLNGDQKPDLLLAGTQHFSVLYAGRKDPALRELASVKLDREGAYPADVIAGDINGDGETDLTVIDTNIDGLQILRFHDETLQPVTHFRVFEEKRLVSESSSRGTEPREGITADVTGDGRLDLLLLCHDRLILYPQDSGADSR